MEEECVELMMHMRQVTSSTSECKGYPLPESVGICSMADLPPASARSDMMGWSRVLLSHTLLLSSGGAGGGYY